MTETAGFLTNAAWRAFADVGSKLASVALFVVMARELGDEGFGVFTFALMYATLFAALAHFGQDAVLIREVARDRSLLDRYFANTVALKLLLSVPVTALALGILAAVGTSSETMQTAALLGLAVAAEAVLASVFAVFQAYEVMRYVAVVLMAQRFATAAVGIAALLAGADVTAVAAIYLGGALLAVALGIAVQTRAVAKPALRVAPSTWTALMRAAVPLGIAGVFGTVLFRVDTVILAAFESTSVVGDYGAAYRLFEATLFVGWSIGGAIYPVLSRLDASEQLSDVYEQALKLSLAATLPLAVGAGVLAAPLIEILYGSDFEDATTALRLLAPSIALFAVVYVTGTVLIARHRQRFLAVAYGVVTVLNIGLNLLLIPLISLEGAALATTATEMLLLVATVGPTRRMLGGVAWARVVTGPGLAAAAAAVVMLALEDWFWLAVATGAGAFVLVLAVVERIAFPADAHAFWAFLRRREVTA